MRPPAHDLSQYESPAREEPIPQPLLLAVAPLHKRALGMAVGTACALLMVLATVFQLVLAPHGPIDLTLLREYFYGYSVTWPGVLVGAWWGFFVGFVGGWFLAFCRNFAIAVSLFITRTRAELEETRDFLDHI